MYNYECPPNLYINFDLKAKCVYFPVEIKDRPILMTQQRYLYKDTSRSTDHKFNESKINNLAMSLQVRKNFQELLVHYCLLYHFTSM